jgi:hypothetical protein
VARRLVGDTTRYELTGLPCGRAEWRSLDDDGIRFARGTYPWIVVHTDIRPNAHGLILRRYGIARRHHVLAAHSLSSAALSTLNDGPPCATTLCTRMEASAGAHVTSFDILTINADTYESQLPPYPVPQQRERRVATVHLDMRRSSATPTTLSSSPR